MLPFAQIRSTLCYGSKLLNGSVTESLYNRCVRYKKKKKKSLYSFQLHREQKCVCVCLILLEREVSPSAAVLENKPSCNLSHSDHGLHSEPKCAVRLLNSRDAFKPQYELLLILTLNLNTHTHTHKLLEQVIVLETLFVQLLE